MSDLIVIQPQVTELTVTEDVNQVVVSSVGVQGPAGATGATGATGAQGPSGVIAVTAPITNSGTSTSANIGVSAGSTSTAGVLQLTDSTSSTSTTTAATPNALKTAYDFTSSQMLPFQVGYYYKGTGANLSSAATATANVTYYVPFFVPYTFTFDRILLRTASSFSGTASVRMGIYNSTNSRPSTVLLDAGTVSATAGSTSYTITINQQLTAGLYFIAANSQTAATTNTYVGIGSNQGAAFNGQPYTSSLAMLQYYSQASVTGAFATAGTLTDGVLSAGIVAFLRGA